jgi:hypothetical protein
MEGGFTSQGMKGGDLCCYYRVTFNDSLTMRRSFPDLLTADPSRLCCSRCTRTIVWRAHHHQKAESDDSGAVHVEEKVQQVPDV